MPEKGFEEEKHCATYRLGSLLDEHLVGHVVCSEEIGLLAESFLFIRDNIADKLILPDVSCCACRPCPLGAFPGLKLHIDSISL